MSDLPERPPIAGEPVSVVLLAHDDETHLEEVVEAWMAQLDRGAGEYEVLLVDEGGTDRTRARAEALATRCPRLRLLPPPVRRGRGAALRSGLEAARHPLLFYTTCDHQYPPADLPLLLKWIDKVDLVSGHRVGPGRPWRQRLAESLQRWLVRLFFAVRLRDVHCWYVLARRSIFARIPIQSDGLFAQAEVLAKANHLGCVMTEVPVTYRQGSEDPKAGQAERRHWWREGYRVLSRPDFGPPVPAAEDR